MLPTRAISEQKSGERVRELEEYCHTLGTLMEWMELFVAAWISIRSLRGYLRMKGDSVAGLSSFCY